MKKVRIVCLALLLILMAGCQNQSEPANISDTSNPSQAPASSSGTSDISTPTPNEDVSEEEPEPVQREDADFRNAKWGDSKETVLEYETETELAELDDGSLGGMPTVAGYDMVVGYIFYDGQLHEAMYALNEEYSNSGQYIPVYNSLKDTLTQIYGEPIEDTIIPMEQQILIDLSGEASALRYGYVLYRSQWETETTNISMMMVGKIFDVYLYISYRDKNFDFPVDDSGL